MRGGTVGPKVRRALAYDTKHRLGLDRGPKARRPEDQHVVQLTGAAGKERQAGASTNWYLAEKTVAAQDQAKRAIGPARRTEACWRKAPQVFTKQPLALTSCSSISALLSHERRTTLLLQPNPPQLVSAAMSPSRALAPQRPRPFPPGRGHCVSRGVGFTGSRYWNREQAPMKAPLIFANSFLSQARRLRDPRRYTSTCCPRNRQQPRQASLLNEPHFQPD